MDPKKVRRLRKLVETIVHRELLEVENEEKGSDNDKGSSAATKALLNFMKDNVSLNQKMKSITNDAHKARAIVDFAALIGIPKSKLQDIVSQIRALAK